MFSRIACLHIAVLSFAIAVVACTSSSNTAPSPGGSSGSSGNTGDDDDDDDDDDGCYETEYPACTKAEIDAYDSCVQTKCGAIVEECYGPDYRSGSYSGSCKEPLSCFDSCGCNDLTCFENCPAPSTACEGCLERLATCTEQCEEPACMKEDPGETGEECSALADCCAAMESEDERSTCEKALELASGNEGTCGALYDAQCK